MRRWPLTEKQLVLVNHVSNPEVDGSKYDDQWLDDAI